MSYRIVGYFPAWCGLTLALISSPSVIAQETSSHYTGVAYAIGTESARYREEHWVVDGPGHRERLVLYRCPDGRAFGRKEVQYGTPPWMPQFTFEDARTGYRESVKADHGRLTVTVRKGSAKRPDSATLEVRPDTVVDAGFDEFVRAHWAELNRPEGTSAYFLVPSRLGDLRLNIKPTPSSDPQFRQFRMALSGWLGALAPTITLTYTATDHRLVQFAGLSNIKDNDGENQKVRIVFPPKDDLPPASEADVAQARSTPLVTKCSP